MSGPRGGTSGVPVTEPIIELLAEEWRALLDLAADFTDGDWAARTDLPAWDVKDCYAHVVGTERSIQGVPVPDVDLSGLDLTAPSALFTEPPVAVRRNRSGPEVLAELEAVVAERLAELRSLPAEEWDVVGPTPLGELSQREFMNVRVFDCWMHEQDVRRALGRPGHQTGRVVELALGRSARAVGFVVGKKVAPPDGTIVEIVLTGPMARAIAVTMAGGRASVAVEDPANGADETGVTTPDSTAAGAATVRLTMDQETFWCLGGGRWDPDAALADGRVALNGDQALGARIVRALNFMI